jgi:hypothetical protein
MTSVREMGIALRVGAVNQCETRSHEPGATSAGSVA